MSAALVPSPGGTLRRGTREIEVGPAVSLRLCIPDDQLCHASDLPAWALELPEGAPLPRVGDVIYLSSTSAWAVELVIHERLSRSFTSIEIWITYAAAARHRRPDGSRIQ